MKNDIMNKMSNVSREIKTTSTNSYSNDSSLKNVQDSNYNYNNKSNQRYDQKVSNKINLDYDWNSEYGDGDIPDIDKL